MDSKAATRPTRPFEISHATVFGIAAPMTLAYLTTPLLGLVDTAVAGRLGDPALLGGLAIGAVIVDLVFTTFNFQRSGTTGLAAQAAGAGNEREKQAILLRALLLAAILGAGSIIASPLVLWISLTLMAPEADIAGATRTYLLIRMLGAPFALANYAVLGWLVGLGRPTLALGLQVLINGINMALSILLGLWLGWGIAGIATATVIAEIIAVIAAVPLCLRLMDRTIRLSRAELFDAAALRRLVSLNGDIMLRSFVLLFAFAFFTAQGTRLGAITLAANAVLMHFFLVGGFFLDGLATAAEQLVGRTIGGNYREGFVRTLRLTTVWNLAMAGALSLFFLVAGEALVNLVTTIPQVREEARLYLWLAALTPLTGVIAFQMDGVYIGATWSRDMSRMMLLSFAVYIVAWAILTPMFGNTGLWLSLHVFLLCRGATLSALIPSKMRQAFG
ncbi:MAG TPA: MATE family efflux transporter [Rhizobiaceae bacterium]|nr:MATE family efflux transporter [Rhizobiaceae bacterium]